MLPDRPLDHALNFEHAENFLLHDDEPANYDSQSSVKLALYFELKN